MRDSQQSVERVTSGREREAESLDSLLSLDEARHYFGGVRSFRSATQLRTTLTRPWRDSPADRGDNRLYAAESTVWARTFDISRLTNFFPSGARSTIFPGPLPAMKRR